MSFCSEAVKTLQSCKEPLLVMNLVLKYVIKDHVAAVIMNCKSEPLIFEANGGFGVGIMPWSQFISKKFYANYDL